MSTIKNFSANDAKTQEVAVFQLSNDWLCVSLCSFGCTILEILSRDRNGNFADVVIGYDKIENYVCDPFYMNSLVGRFAGRIKNATYCLGGTRVELERNVNGLHHLHGGPIGFNKQFWQLADIPRDENFVVLEHTSSHNDQGHPGILELTAKFELINKTFNIEYTAKSSLATHVNLTQHIYFNLSGVNRRAHAQTALPLPLINNHVLEICSSQYLETDFEIIPTGNIISVASSDLDFRKPRSLGETVLDTYFSFDQISHSREQVRLIDPTSGRRLSMSSTQPGLQIYTSEYLSNIFPGKNGTTIDKRSAICLEFQGFPDAPNQPHFPSTLLPAESCRQYRTSYTFDTIECI